MRPPLRAASSPIRSGAEDVVQPAILGALDEHGELRLRHLHGVREVIADFDLLGLGRSRVLENLGTRRATARPTQQDHGFFHTGFGFGLLLCISLSPLSGTRNNHCLGISRAAVFRADAATM